MIEMKCKNEDSANLDRKFEKNNHIKNLVHYMAIDFKVKIPNIVVTTFNILNVLGKNSGGLLPTFYKQNRTNIRDTEYTDLRFRFENKKGVG